MSLLEAFLDAVFVIFLAALIIAGVLATIVGSVLVISLTGLNAGWSVGLGIPLAFIIILTFAFYFETNWSY